MDAHIYCVTNLINGKQYVGQTTVNRNKVGHGQSLKGAYNKYGKEQFSYERVCVNIPNRETLNYLECFWISVCNTIAPNGYNIESGGSDKGEVSQSTRLKLKISMKGKKISLETRLKISLANKGVKNSFYGKKHTPESLLKISAANIGKTVVISEATKEKIRQTKLGDKNPMYGKPITEEHRAKLKANSAHNRPWLGKKIPDEHKAHLSFERTCPHCNKIGKGNAMIRYHMDNCKDNL